LNKFTDTGQCTGDRIIFIYVILQLIYAKNDYKSLPFAGRWFRDKFSAFKIKYAINQLLLAGAIFKYPILKEEANGIVTQAEHTVIVKNNGYELITQLENTPEKIFVLTTETDIQFRDISYQKNLWELLITHI